jgi:hypothetical protein
MIGEALPDNRPLIGLARRLGFEVRAVTMEGVVKLRLNLQ